MTTQQTSTVTLRIADALGDNEGQGLVEYTLILAFVAVVAIVVLNVLGPDIAQYLTSIGNSL
jgi:Flp pilus assembly pilin Flp